jgi:rhamnulokinase/L-fuculokinase
MSRYLIFDYGASSGRAMIATYVNGKIEMEEIHRFTNDPVVVNGTMYWDILRLFFEMKTAISKAVNNGGFDYIGIDTWGVDFAFVDKDGQLLQNPVHYRDSRTNDWEELFDIIPRDELYAKTGIQLIPLNTIYQLYAVKKRQPWLFDQADKIIFIPDLLAYFLTGVKYTEYSMASTTQLLDAKKRTWDKDILSRLGIPERLFLPISMAGDFVGTLLPEIQEELGAPAAKVVRTAGHDTGSAVLATPTQNDDFVYISCGTWALLGTEIKEPCMNDLARKYNFANEGGATGDIRFLKNIMGTWLLAESRRQWAREGKQYSFGEMETLAKTAEPFKCFIDPDDQMFAPPGNMPKRIREYCEKTGQRVPETVAEIVRCVDESLAMKFRMCIDQTEEATGKKFPAVNILGGGVQSALLCQMTANAAGRKVVAGPIEATALGNLAMQLIASGAIADVKAARKAIEESFDTFYYEAQDTELWNEAYQRFCKVVNK